MSGPRARRTSQRLDDVLEAIKAIHSHTSRGGLEDGLVFDAVRMRILEIGEAVKAVPPELLGTEPGIPWNEVRRMRDQLAHRYFATDLQYVQSTVLRDLGDLESAVRRLQGRLAHWPDDGSIPAPGGAPTPGIELSPDPSCGVTPLNPPRAGRQQG